MFRTIRGNRCANNLLSRALLRFGELGVRQFTLREECPSGYPKIGVREEQIQSAHQNTQSWACERVAQSEDADILQVRRLSVRQYPCLDVGRIFYS